MGKKNLAPSKVVDETNAPPKLPKANKMIAKADKKKRKHKKDKDSEVSFAIS
jgi:hypothetical protein